MQSLKSPSLDHLQHFEQVPVTTDRSLKVATSLDRGVNTHDSGNYSKVIKGICERAQGNQLFSGIID